MEEEDKVVMAAVRWIIELKKWNTRGQLHGWQSTAGAEHTSPQNTVLLL